MQVPCSFFIDQGRKRRLWAEEDLAFMERLLQSSGMGDATYFPGTHRPPGSCGVCGGRWHCMAVRLWFPGEACGQPPAQLDLTVSPCAQGNLVSEPMDLSWAASLREAEMVLFETVDLMFQQQPWFRPQHVSAHLLQQLLPGLEGSIASRRAGVQVDILVVCCSCFAPTPSLASMSAPLQLPRGAWC